MGDSLSGRPSREYLRVTDQTRVDTPRHARVVVIGVPTPVLGDVVIDTSRGVLSEEVEHVRLDVIRGVEGVEGRIRAATSPECRWTFVAIGYASAIRIRISPIGSNLLFDGVWNSVSIGVERIQVIIGIVLRIRTIDIFLIIGHTTIVGIGVIPQRSVIICAHVATIDTEHHRASCCVFEPIIQPVTIEISEIVAWFVGICTIENLIQIID